jgi:beta-RFAP synthase
MIRIRTPSRLHFGLIALPTSNPSENEPAWAKRQCGGVGLMIDQPGIEIAIDRTATWSADGPLAERALQYAQTYCASIGAANCFRIRVLSVAPEHSGLGTGTQLGLAVARGIAELMALPAIEKSAATLAKHVRRGLRSAVGIHGFQSGGFIVEAGKTASDALSPMVARHDFPESWGVLVVLPRGLHGVHGRMEIDAFANLAERQGDDRPTEALCRIVLIGMLPALVESDLDAFGEAVYDFNRRVGAMFAKAQGGIYAHARIEAIVKHLRQLGVKGVGQSSWGPAVFAIAPADDIDWVREALVAKQIVEREESIVARAWNQGAQVIST